MLERVAVEEGLDPVVQLLESEGYETIPLSEADVDDVLAVVVSGMDTEFLGIADTDTLAPVIDADGATPEEILHRIREL